MTPSRKEPSLAFMPTPNDAIHTSRDLDGYPSPRSSLSNHKSESDFHKHHLLSHESVVLSPLSRTRSEDPMASYVRSGSDLPLRASVASASPLPHENTTSLEPRTDTHWQELYFELCTHNDKVVRGLRQHIDILEEELRKSRNDSGTFQYPWTENNNPKLSTTHHSSRDKGKKSSFGNSISPTNGHVEAGGISIDESASGVSLSGDSEQRRSSSTGNQSSRGVSFGQLQSIPEHGNTNQAYAGSMDTTHGSIANGSKWLSEDPPSPPTTAMVPSPPHLKTLAGRTPPDPAMIEQRPINDINGQRFSGNDGVDDDPALQEPRIISGASEMEDLDRRLKQVASNPDMHQPQALQSEPYMQSSVENGSDSGGHSAGDAVEGVILKRKASTNFGVAWGMARNDVPKRS